MKEHRLIRLLELIISIKTLSNITGMISEKTNKPVSIKVKLYDSIEGGIKLVAEDIVPYDLNISPEDKNRKL